MSNPRSKESVELRVLKDSDRFNDNRDGMNFLCYLFLENEEDSCYSDPNHWVVRYSTNFI